MLYVFVQTTRNSAPRNCDASASTGTRCVTLFSCTAPWEIFDYGIQRKITSPLLAEFFFKRGMDERAITAIPLNEVSAAVLEQLR